MKVDIGETFYLRYVMEKSVLDIHVQNIWMGCSDVAITAEMDTGNRQSLIISFARLIILFKPGI